MPDKLQSRKKLFFNFLMERPYFALKADFHKAKRPAISQSIWACALIFVFSGEKILFNDHDFAGKWRQNNFATKLLMDFYMNNFGMIVIKNI